jgi:hypothetical protein
MPRSRRPAARQRWGYQSGMSRGERAGLSLSFIGQLLYVIVGYTSNPSAHCQTLFIHDENQ